MCYELHVGCHELRVNWVLVLVWPIGSYAGYGPPPSSCTQRPASNLLSDSEYYSAGIIADPASGAQCFQTAI